MSSLRSRALPLLSDLLSLVPKRVCTRLLPERLSFYGHLVHDGDHPARRRYRYPNSAEFAAFVKAIGDLGYQISALTEYLKDDGERRALFTFDDGFSQVATFIAAQRLLSPSKFVVFVGSGGASEFAIPGVGSSRDPGLLVDADEIQRLRGMGVHIGFHGALHRQLPDNYDKGDLRTLIGDVRARIGEFSQPRAFAYPYKAPFHRAAADDFVRDAGFDVIFGTEFDWRTRSAYERISLDIANDMPVELNPCLFQLNMLLAKRFLRVRLPKSGSG